MNNLKLIEYSRDRTNQKIHIKFRFGKNSIMKNEYLTKTFIMSDEETAVESKGTPIEWKKDLTKMNAFMVWDFF